MEPAVGKRPLRMSQSLKLRALLNERLSAAAEDILLLFERIMAEFEEELLGAKGGEARGTQSPEPALEEPEADRSKRAGVQAVSSCSIKPETPAQIYIKMDPDLCIKQEEEEPLPFNMVSLKVEDSVCRKSEKRRREISSNGDGQINKTRTLDKSLVAHLETEGHGNGVFMIATDITPQSSHPQMFSHSDIATAVPNRRIFPLPSAPAVSDSVKKQKLHKCRQCNKVYHHSSSLFRHIVTHKEQKPFRCSVCQKGFSQKPHLKAHTRIHTGERPFSCPFCARTFCNKSNMSQHVKVHTGERPFPCSVCDMRFGCLRTMTTHMRTHTGERPFHCPQCNLTFKHQTTLDAHKRAHDGVKPYSCSMCDRSFAQKRSLTKHLMEHMEQQSPGGGDAAADLGSEQNSVTNEGN